MQIRTYYLLKALQLLELVNKTIMARGKKIVIEQKVKLINTHTNAVSELLVQHANNLFAYQIKHGKNCWEVHKDSQFEYNKRDGFIIKPNTGNTDK